MKPVKCGLGFICLALMAGCSNSDALRQASGGFKYLDTPELSKWKYLPNQKVSQSNLYAIPTGDFGGPVGDGVDIRPPEQLLSLIPGARFDTTPNSVTIWVPSEQTLQTLISAVNTMMGEDKLSLIYGATTLETDWVEQSDGADSTAKTRFALSLIKQHEKSGFRIALLDWTNDEALDIRTLNDFKLRFLTNFTNQLMTIYEEEERNKARVAANDLMQQIPINLGKDRGGLGVVIARASFSIMWERLPSLLTQMGFEIEERNRSQGTINVNYSPPNDDFFEKIQTQPLVFEQRNLKIQLGDLGNRTSINMTNSKDKPVSEETLSSLAEVLTAVMKFDSEK